MVRLWPEIDRVFFLHSISVPLFSSWCHNFFHMRNPWGSKSKQRTINYRGETRMAFLKGCACLCNKSWALTTICGQGSKGPSFELPTQNARTLKQLLSHSKRANTWGCYETYSCYQWEPWEWRDGSPSYLFMDWQLTWIWNWNLCNQGCLKTSMLRK